MRNSIAVYCAGVLLSLLLPFAPAFSAPPRPSEVQRDTYEYKIAMNDGKKWRYFLPGETYHVDFGNGRAGAVIFYVGVPKYDQDYKYQVLFVKTSYMKEQPIALVKNGPIPCFIPFFPAKEDTWEDDLSSNAFQDFVNYHDDKNAYNGKNRKKYSSWHDNYFWNLNLKKGTYDFVHKIQLRSEKKNPGTERLIRMAKNRPKISWARITSIIPKRRDTLRVMVSFSGEKTDEVAPHEYIFVNVDGDSSVPVIKVK
ncbi:hypothetical protein EST62_02475 [Chlorobaculum sp. 24CR]|uniref:hypothetical protein n=1 Tax=Chlorobaculum sp. 24CR TaxID=2508878 RepID=UPI00100B10AD|nr:hypothetical protein [Chlorobaculum sp. 24CR]RXK88525.1 hypothetical protein EST62_02475 [Chlorobaculum sp. 24CR]